MSNKPSSGQRAVQPLANSNSKANRPSSGQKPTGSPSAKRGSRASAAAAAARAKDPLRYKTVECENWARDGKCPYGARCQFAHGAHELRSRSTNTAAAAAAAAPKPDASIEGKARRGQRARRSRKSSSETADATAPPPSPAVSPTASTRAPSPLTLPRTVLPAAPLGSPTTSGSSRRSSNAAPALYSSLFSPESPRSPISLTPSSLPPPRRRGGPERGRCASMGERSTSRCPRKNGGIPSSLWCGRPFGWLDSSRRCNPVSGGRLGRGCGNGRGRRSMRYSRRPCPWRESDPTSRLAAPEQRWAGRG